MSRDLMLNVAAFTLQVGVIAAAAALLLQVLRIASAGTRYLCWRVVLAACLVMPLVLQRPPAAASRGCRLTNRRWLQRSGMPTSSRRKPRRRRHRARGSRGHLSRLSSSACGACARAAWLAVGLIRLRALRRRGIAIEDATYDEIQSTLGTRAALRCVDGLTQPATFGVWRPVVLLPGRSRSSRCHCAGPSSHTSCFTSSDGTGCGSLPRRVSGPCSGSTRRILWLTSRIQLAREELVDELTVLATGNRRAYIEALMTFADAGPGPSGAGIRPAPPVVHSHREAIEGGRHVVTPHRRLGLASSSRPCSALLVCESRIPHRVCCRYAAAGCACRGGAGTGRGTRPGSRADSRRGFMDAGCAGAAERRRPASRSGAGDRAACRDEADHAGKPYSAPAVRGR
jgi:hypothetical protein